MPQHSNGAQRASSRRIRSLVTTVLAALFLVTAIVLGGAAGDTTTRPDAFLLELRVTEIEPDGLRIDPPR